MINLQMNFLNLFHCVNTEWFLKLYIGFDIQNGLLLSHLVIMTAIQELFIGTKLKFHKKLIL